ncbi:MAG TPA: alpha/beta fold hydrolase [Myxococcota bacterium]|nr:alpha/beta fold hydrolase [Myxococcota bacterium]
MLGGDTLWRESGSGPPLLLLHGVPTSSLLFRDVMDHLPGRVIAPDLPGYGDSAPLRAVDLGAYVDWLEAFLSMLGLDSVTVAGQDFGAYLGAGLAGRGRVEALVLTSTALSWGWAPSVLAALPPFDRLFYSLFGGRAYLARAERGQVLTALHVGRIESDPDLVGRMRRTALAIRGVDPEPLRQIPTTCIWGSEDPLFPAWMGRRTAAAIGARWQLIEGGRHTLPWDRPLQWAAAVREFLQGNPD